MGWVLLKKLFISVEGQMVATMVKGLATGSWMRVPTTSAEVKAEINYVLYDYKYRPIRSYTTNYLGGYTYTDSKLDVFSGQLQYTIQKHKRTIGDNELTVKEAFTYTAQDRLIQHTHQINGGAEQLLADNTYDELGQLISKKVGNTSTTPLQKVDYSYNIRGWMKSINNPNALQQGSDPADLFGFKINYNTVEGSATAANKLYNGNIAETFWSTATDGGFVRNYGYKYDNLNRLKDATYQKSGQVTGMYNENLSYDKNGNIMNLSRYGDRDEQYLPIQIDNLGYNYGTNSNQLKSVTDATNNTSGFKDGNTTGDDYEYDANGNMTVDKNKNITGIVYNHLNLPTKIIFPTGNIVYFYNASGQKVQKVVTENTTVTTTDYLGGYQYKNAVLQFFPTAEGYVKNTPVSGINTYSYVFNYTDHLGNTRLSYAKDTTTGSLKILEENNYYPFGLKHNNYNVDNFQPGYKYKYNGKELQDELGLNMYDYGARNYDPALGRWMNIDPKSELLEISSPYVYALNCPVIYLDKDGELPIFINGKTSSDSERGNASYWGAEIIATVQGSGIANPGGQIHYVDGDRWQSPYTHKIENSSWNQGGINNASFREAAGYKSMTTSEFKSILSKLERNDQGKIIEKIQIYTHSREAAFGTGYTERLLELIKENADQFADANNVVDFMFNMAPHQSNDIAAPDGVDSYSLDRTKDPLSGNDMSGVKGAFTTDEGGYKKAHSISTFGKDLTAFTSSFSIGGSSKDVINNFVKTMKDKYIINVTVKE